MDLGSESSDVPAPVIRLICDTGECGGFRFFDPYPSTFHLYTSWVKLFFTYKCRHCGKTEKTYALLMRRRTTQQANAVKLGEWPVFAPHVPARVLAMVGDDQRLFMKGRQAEALGLGIAAFAYYRRVVENQKSRLIEEIAKVARRVGTAAATIELIEDAAKETRFTAAVDKIRDAIPETLRLKGHNPLTLLHGLLSDGLHAQTDEECLDYATDIRILLSELCDKISSALKSREEVETALSRLLQRGKKKKVESGQNETTSKPIDA